MNGTLSPWIGVRYREQGISRLGVGQVWRGALGVNVVGGSLCMDLRLKASLSLGANVLWELEVSGGSMHLYQHL